MNKKTIFSKDLKFKPSYKGGGTFSLEIRLEEKVGKNIRNWDTLEVLNEPVITLSICGKCRNGNGQCSDKIRAKVNNFKESERKLINKILDIWDEYHLNDVNAGTKYQTELLDNFVEKDVFKRYEEKCSYLESHNALSDRGYVYGTDWLYREIPSDVVEFIKNL